MGTASNTAAHPVPPAPSATSPVMIPRPVHPQPSTASVAGATMLPTTLTVLAGWGSAAWRTSSARGGTSGRRVFVRSNPLPPRGRPRPHSRPASLRVIPLPSLTRSIPHSLLSPTTLTTLHRAFCPPGTYHSTMGQERAVARHNCIHLHTAHF